MITEVKLAEVLEVNVTNNTLVVRTISDNIERTYDNVRPADINQIKLALPGEHVFIIKGLREESTEDIRRYDWYYLNPYSLQSNVNNNLLPGVTTKIPKLNSLFTDTNILSLQSFIGDNIYQGRWGNTIRLGSSIDSEERSISSNWSSSDTKNSPIIIISNNKPNTNIESVNDAYSSLWLTSTQTISNFTTNNPLRKSKTIGSSLIASADKIILKSKDDVVALDSNKAIELNAPIISMGVNKDKEGILHSTVIIEILGDLIQILISGTAKGDRLLLSSQLIPLLTKLSNAENTKILQDKL
jgi:hypothetical protein